MECVRESLVWGVKKGRDGGSGGLMVAVAVSFSVGK